MEGSNPVPGRWNPPLGSEAFVEDYFEALEFAQ